jgi:hypothetical protein
MLIFSALCRGAWYFGAPKYPKRFVNPAMWLLIAHAHQKNSGTSFCVQFILNFEFNANEHKTTAFQV